MKIPVIRLILLLMLSTSTVFAGQIFKCVSTDESVTFSDTPCKDTGGDQKTVDEFDSRVTTYGSGYPDGYQSSVESPYADEISRNQQRSAAPPNYIDIPPDPVKPDAPAVHTRTVPGTPHIVPSTQGGHVLRTGERSYIDPATGRVEEGEFIGDRYDKQQNYVDPEESQAHKEAMRDYENAKYDREVTIESEKHAAKVQNRNASPQYCGEMQYKIAQAKQQRDSLDRQMDQLESSRPSSRASAKQRSSHHKRTKKSKENLKEQMSANRRQQQEHSNNYRRLCR